MLVGIAILLVAASVGLVAHAINLPRVRVQGSLAQIEDYGFEGDTHIEEPVTERRSPIVAVGAGVMRRVGGKTLAEQRRLLMSAGLYEITAEKFVGYRVAGAVGVPLIMAQVASSGSALTGIFVLAFGALVGWRLPQIVVANRAKQRLVKIDRSMPELVDLLVVGVESGIGFNGAIRAAASRVDGPLGHELRLMLQEQSLGVSMSEALERVLHRCDTPAARAFVRTINQGDKLGISIGHILRNLAEEMRKRRKAQAEEQAHKAPVKILFPLVFLIFPSIFIVLLTPAAMSILEGFGGGS
jgi:tight adherence protein C